MTSFPDLLRRLASLALRLALALAAAVFAASLLLAVLLLLALGTLRALLTGRKPAASVLWGRYRAFQARGAWPGHPAAPGAGRPDVVDVEAREVASAPGRLRDGAPPR